MLRFPPLAVLFSSLVLGLFVGCAPDDSDLPEVAIATCEEVINNEAPGDEAPVDFMPGVEEELAELDLSQLPTSVDISPLIALYRGFVAYALEVPPDELGETIDRDEAAASGPLGQVVLGALLLGQGDPTGIDFSFFRRGFQRYYTCSRSFPTSLDGFIDAILDYETLEEQVVDSAPKCGPRRLLTSPADGVFVAESIIDGEVRETEILLSNRRSDGQLDFAVYNSDGSLDDRSLFPTLTPDLHVVASAPYTCMTCHVDTESSETTWGFNVLMPTGTGACADE